MKKTVSLILAFVILININATAFALDKTKVLALHEIER